MNARPADHPAAVRNSCLNHVCSDILHNQLNSAVPQRERVAHLDVLHQALVADFYSFGIAAGSASLYRNQGVGSEIDASARKRRSTDFRPRQVKQNPHRPPRLLRHHANETVSLQHALHAVVRQADARHIHARADHLLQHFRAVGRRADSGDYLGSSHT